MAGEALPIEPGRKTAQAPGRMPPSAEERRLKGKALREACPRQSHAGWAPAADRPDPVALIEATNVGRVAALIPERHRRMVENPFAWFRGAACVMAADLARTPTTGLRVQACGDCHLLNFGAFATPERRIVFDINDLDETFPAPWEWDVKRLATSVILACRANTLGDDAAKEAARTCVRSYREGMAEFAGMTALDVWYSSIPAEEIVRAIKDDGFRRRIQKRVEEAGRRRPLSDDDPDLARGDDGVFRIVKKPDRIFELSSPSREELLEMARAAFDGYRGTLTEARRRLLDRYRIQDVAFKVAGIGSVGTYCCVLLLMAGEDDHLFLQVKEAQPSVLERFAGEVNEAGHDANQGRRVVAGTQLVQSASDLFLGWTEVAPGRHFYLRQLRDGKVGVKVEELKPGVLSQYAWLCGKTLARAHARSGDPAAIGGYLGQGDAFDDAVATFASRYADQTEVDHLRFVAAAKSGRIDVAKK